MCAQNKQTLYYKLQNLIHLRSLEDIQTEQIIRGLDKWVCYLYGEVRIV